MTTLKTIFDEYILDHVNGLIAANLDSARQYERRADRRFAFPYVMEIRPEEQSAAEPTLIVGRHMSYGGLDFYHQRPLPFRQGIVSVETSCRQWLRILIDVTWCRFIRQSWYLSGGRFLNVVESPSSAPENSD